MSLDKYASEGENKFVRRMVTIILKKGMLISIDNGGAFVVRRSKMPSRIYPNMATTGEDRLLIHERDGTHVGTFWLVYGNAPSGEELIADYSGNDLCDQLWKEFMQVYN